MVTTPHVLENIVVRVPEEYYGDPFTQAREAVHIATEVALEITRAREKCRELTIIDGQAASVTGLELSGEHSIEKIAVTYILAGGGSLRKEYSRKEFYEL